MTFKGCLALQTLRNVHVPGAEIIDWPLQQIHVGRYRCSFFAVGILSMKQSWQCPGFVKHTHARGCLMLISASSMCCHLAAAAWTLAVNVGRVQSLTCCVKLTWGPPILSQAYSCKQNYVDIHFGLLVLDAELQISLALPSVCWVSSIYYSYFCNSYYSYYYSYFCKSNFNSSGDVPQQLLA